MHIYLYTCAYKFFMHIKIFTIANENVLAVSMIELIT